MRVMTMWRAALLAFVLCVAPLAAAEQTWTGVISDSACGAKHEEAAEGADRMSDRDCTLACVKGGSAYVLVVDGSVLKIANQNFEALAANAGRAVRVTGEMAGGSVKVTAIQPK
jgi:hypothetical protein